MSVSNPRKGSNAEPLHSNSPTSVNPPSIGFAASGNETDLYKSSVHNRAYETRGIRFVPAEIIFYNAFRGQTYSTLITMTNISSRIIHLAISQPYSSAFHVTDTGATIMIAPGLSISKTIIFKCAEGKLFDSVVPIRIEKTLVLIPIKVVPGQTRVVVEPSSVDFGRIDLGSAFVSKKVKIHNKGSISSKFAIDRSNNELDIMITPRSGNISPFGTVDIKIQLAGLLVGEHATEFWVKSTPPSRFTVTVTIVVPFLQAIHPFATDEFTLLDMAPCFPGSHSYETFLVRNASSDKSSVVVHAECDGMITTLDNAAHMDPSFKFFKIDPSDGILAPFECRAFTVRFSPQKPFSDKGWKMQQKDTTSQYLCFFRIQRVTVSSSGASETVLHFGEENRCVLERRAERSDDERFTQTTKLNCLENRENDNIIRVCAYSISVLPRIKFVPDELIFENVGVNQQVDKVLHLTNICDLPLGVEYVKQAHISVTPSKVDIIKPKKSIEVLVKLNPISLNFEYRHLAFNLLSFRNMTDQSGSIAVGRVYAKLSVSIKSNVTALVPKFLPGITPRVHPEGEEVGLHSEKVVFSAIHGIKVPARVDWPHAKSHKSKPWLSSNARVAFPNERRRSLRVTAHDANARSIFTGLPRYNVPVDTTNVHSTATLTLHRQIEKDYRKVIAKQAATKKEILEHEDADGFPPAEEYSVDNKNLYALLGAMPPISPPEWTSKQDKSITHDPLCPLTPLELFNVKVQPQVLDFGKMPPRTDCSTNVAVENMNPFAIEARFKSYKASLKVPEKSFTVPAQSTVFQRITLNLEATGKHYTNMRYTINTCHSYDIKVCADVETRSLCLEPEELTFRESKGIIEKHCLPVKLNNPLAAPCSFSWKIPQASPFTVVPNSGSVQARSALTCCVFFSLMNCNQLGTVLSLQVDDGTSSLFPVNFMPSNQLSLMLFSPKISCPNISIGIKTEKKIILYNYGRQLTFFSVDDRELPNNVKILPFTGIVKPRSCCTLKVVFYFTEIKKFSYSIPIITVGNKNLLLTCNGFANYPKVKFKPNSFLFRKTPVHALSTASFDVVNESKTDVNIKFNMENYPQFWISASPDFLDEASTLIPDVNLMLLPLETRKLNLHFAPHDLAGYSFLLPVIVNDILGPPVLNKPCTVDPKAYVDVTPVECKLSQPTVGAVPDKLDSIKIEVAVQRGYIECSSYVFEFFKTDYKEKGGQSVTIKNIFSAGPITLRIKPPLVQAFTIHYKGDDICREELIVLDKGSSVELLLIFQPLVAGTYQDGMPIFVEEFSTEKPYIILKLTGVFYRSTLLCSTSLVNFLPVNVSVEIDRIINITANYQPEETKLSIEIIGVNGESLNDIFDVSYPSTNVIPYGIDNFVIPVRIKFISHVPTSVIGMFTARDGFDGECQITVTAIADRSTLTTYAFQFMNSLHKPPGINFISDQSIQDLSNSSLTCSQQIDGEIGEQLVITEEIINEIQRYPLFPENQSETLYAKYMRRTKESIEDWLYEQGFQGVFRISIDLDYNFSKQYQDVLHSSYKNAHFSDIKGILNLITKLTGRGFTSQYPLPPNIPRDPEGRVEYAIVAYVAVVNFLARQGGHLTHVSPIYLLCYEDYLIYHRKLKPLHVDETSNFYSVSQLNTILPKSKFCRLSTQCWMDVFLQLYKVLVLYPVIMDPKRNSSLISAHYSSDFADKSIKSKTSKRTIPSAEQGNCEDALLTWLTDVFTVSRPDCVYPRIVTNLVQDLEDGVVLGVITTYFCPFLFENYLSSLYLNPCNIAEGTLVFEACLADSISKEIKLTNPSDQTIGFSIVKFDPNNNFSIVKSKKKSIIVPPKKSCRISINFYAKSANSVSGTLLFCGTHYPGGYASNLVFSLKGTPAKLQHRFAYNILCPLYKVANVKTNLNSPFNSEGEFLVTLTEHEPKPGVAGKLKSWEMIRTRKVIRPIYLEEGTVNIPPSNGLPVPYSAVISALHLKTKEYWLLFSNQKIGDFVVKISIIPDTRTPHYILRVPLPTEQCVSPLGPCDQVMCPRRVNLRIPAKNLKLWSAVKGMLSQTLRKSEKTFWDEYLETGLGLKLIAWISRQYSPGQVEMNFLYQTKVTYRIECDSTHVRGPDSFTIDDVHSEGTVDVPVHISPSAKLSSLVGFKMKSDNEKELRYYQIAFTSDHRRPTTATNETKMTVHVNTFETPEPNALQVWCVPTKDMVVPQSMDLVSIENNTAV